MIQQNTKNPAQTDISESVQIIYLNNRRYGYLDQNGRITEFSCGHSVDILIRDGNILRWMPTRFEHDGNDYYLVGYPGVPLCGLTVRERRDSR